MTIDVFERYASLDPAKAPGIQPQWSTRSDVPLTTVDARGTNMQTQQEIPAQPKSPRPKQTGWLVAAAAFVLILVVGAVVFITNSDDAAPPADLDPTTVTPTEALATSDAYFAANNSGDAEGAMALFTPTATFRNNFTGVVSRTEFEEALVWNAAQGTTLTSDGCTTKQEGVSVRVSCAAATHDAPIQAVDASPVYTFVTLLVTPDGIGEHAYSYGYPDFNVVGDPFGAWILANHPADYERTGFGTWSNLDEARANGLLVAVYAEEWAEYLTQKGCSYLDGC